MSTSLSTDIVGRDEALEELRNTVDDVRLVTLRGPGGVGKTTLSAALADERDGVFVELQTCESAADVAVQVADALQLVDTMRNVGGVKKALASGDYPFVVLDNAEHIAGEVADLLGEWLIGTATRFVVTSRVRLSIPSEKLLDLRPLGVSDAFELFARRASTALPSFEVTEENRDAVMQLVEVLEGLPLAVELAAARVRVLTPQQILERLSRQVDLLKDCRADVDRHATLDACIDWSWDLLDPAERTTLAQCSIFRGGFSMEDAEAVVDVQDWVGDSLERLVEHSLIRVDQDATRTRFMIYDAVLRHVERREEPDEALARRFGDLLLEKARSSRIEHYDLVNLLKVFELAMEFEPNYAADLLTSVRRKLLRGGFEERFSQLVEAALATDIGPLPRSRFMVSLAAARYTQIEFAECDRLLVEAKELLDTVDDGDTLEPRAQLLMLQAVRLNELQRPAEAEATLAAARERHEELPDALAAHMLSVSGIAAMKSRDFVRCAEFFEQAVKRARRTPDIALRARTLSWSAYAPMATGDLDRAIDRLAEALDIFAKTEDFVSTTHTRYTLAQLMLSRDEQAAIEHAHAASLLARKAGLKILQAMTTIFLTRVTNPDDAPSIIRRALEVFGSDVAKSDRWSGWLTLVCIHASRGDLESASDEVGRLLRTLGEVGADEDIERARRYAAVIAALSGDLEALETQVAGDPEFGQTLRGAVEGELDREAAAALAHPYDRMLLDFLPLPLELYEQVVARWRSRRTMRVIDDGNRIALPDGEEIDLESRYVLRRLMVALCEHHEQHRGTSMTLDELVEAGWPDETMTYDSGIRRVYSAIRNLRKLGFEEIVQTGENGYLIDPELEIARDN